MNSCVFTGHLPLHELRVPGEALPGGEALLHFQTLGGLRGIDVDGFLVDGARNPAFVGAPVDLDGASVRMNAPQMRRQHALQSPLRTVCTPLGGLSLERHLVRATP